MHIAEPIKSRLAQEGKTVKLSIIILCYNKWNFTKSCLKDLSHLPTDTHEIVIVDNASSDETYQEMIKLCNETEMNLVYIRNPHNYGFAGGCNIGFTKSIGENVLFLNNDIRVKSNHTNWTSAIISSCDEGLVGPTMGQLDNDLNFIQEANKILSGKSYMSGWCLGSSKENWNKLNISNTDISQIFSEEFFCYFEDTDLSFRARQLKILFKLVDVPVIHFGRVSSKQLNTNKLYSDARRIFINKWKNKI